MAFFGISSNIVNYTTSSLSSRSATADLTPRRTIAISKEVRQRGVYASRQHYAWLGQEYAQAYAVYQQLEAGVSQRTAVVEKALHGIDAPLRQSLEVAARARLEQWKEGGSDESHPKYNSVVSTLDDEHRNVVDTVLVPFYSMKSQLEDAENALWVKHASLCIEEQLCQLWEFEYRAAEDQEQRMDFEVDGGVEKNASHLRQFQQRLTEIRKKNLRRKTKEKTVTRHAARISGTETTTKSDSSSPSVAQTSTQSRNESTADSTRTMRRRQGNAKVDANEWL